MKSQGKNVDRELGKTRKKSREKSGNSVSNILQTPLTTLAIKVANENKELLFLGLIFFSLKFLALRMKGLSNRTESILL